VGGWSSLGVSTNFGYLFEWMLANKIDMEIQVSNVAVQQTDNKNALWQLYQIEFESSVR
jgi:hypothetical protein